MRTSTRLLAIMIAMLLLASCGKQPTAPAPAPLVEVGVITVEPSRLALTTELPGRLEASRVSQVRARVPGIVLKRTFEEGSNVKAGQVLFRIDPAPLQAAFASSQAAVAKSEANVAQTTLKLKRYKPLVETNAISKQEYDDAETAQKQALADLASSRSARQSASLNLGYATVKAPIAGRIGRAAVTEGALVGQGEATPLATVQQVDPIYVNLTQSSTEVLRLRRALASGKLQSAGPDAARISLLMEDGIVYPQIGKLLFSDVTVDESSGAITMRAEFPNSSRMLMPGMYVRARLEQAINEAALTVPQQAVQRTTDGATVMVVGADDKVATRPIKADNAQGNSLIVTAGLKPGERVIVEGIQKVKPGATVRAVAWSGPNIPDGMAQASSTPSPATRQQAKTN
ncbi:MAG: efflux RND transporter periplasmic adaptor subunit [Burkholderiaceae bacterium]